jgi:hypothetical protein
MSPRMVREVLVMAAQKIGAEIARGIVPNRMDMVRLVLSIVVLDH